MTTSTRLASRRNAAWPSASSRSRTMPRLLVWRYANDRLRSGPGSPSRNGPRRRRSAPPGGSTRITLAPRSARSLPAYSVSGPATSRTRSPARGPGPAAGEGSDTGGFDVPRLLGQALGELVRHPPHDDVGAALDDRREAALDVDLAAHRHERAAAVTGHLEVSVGREARPALAVLAARREV